MNKKNLIDTHAFLWFIDGNKELSKTARLEIEAEGAINFISIASLWEIAIKVSLGKLILNTDFNKINDKIIQNGFEILAITFEDTVEISSLPFHHRDPFDRIIIAQAITNNLTLISKDEHFSKYLSKIIY
ncbi:MAG: type II toxin-antitoxin system VapC family toxin [Ginsengibacter sp.]|jgi:PIN domain nuclease of toxin-antitoxin system